MLLHACGDSLHACPSLIDFIRCMYDILEGAILLHPSVLHLPRVERFQSVAHRWVVQERNILHCDISHCNIFVQAGEFNGESEEESTVRGIRPIFVNEILDDVDNAKPTASLVDMDNAAELNRDKALSQMFVEWEKKVSMNEVDGHSRFRTGTPKFIARSPAVRRLLVTNLAFRRMPQLKGDLAEKYHKAYSKDPSGLRMFVDDLSTKHGGVYDADQVEEKYDERPELIVTDFEHRPRHDAESIFWCMVVFLLGAVPLGSPDEVIPNDPDGSPPFCAWRHIANHRVGPSKDICDSRAGLLSGGKPWNEWLHPGLAHAGPLLAVLASQVSPEWSLLDPQPRDLHLHEAMQRIILKHIDLWMKNDLDVKLDTGRVRTTTPPDNHKARNAGGGGIL